MLGDVNLAEPNALIGFAGARVAAGTTGDELSEGFQRSEFLFAHGFLDQVVTRAELRDTLATMLRFMTARPHPSTVAVETADSNGERAHGEVGATTDTEAIRG